MAALKPSTALKKQREKLGLSLRQLEDQSGVSRRTIRRCEAGEFPSDSAKVEDLISFLFQQKTKRNEVMEAIDKKSKLTQKEILDRRKLRKELTKASRQYIVDVQIVTQPSIPNNIRQEWIEISEKEPALSYEQIKEKLDFKFYYDEPLVFVHLSEPLFDHKGEYKSEHRILTINRERGLVFFGEQGDDYFSKPFKKNGKTYYQEHGTDGCKENWQAAMEPYWKFCRKRKLSLNVLLELVRKEVIEDKFLQSEHYQAKQEHINTDQRWRMWTTSSQIGKHFIRDDEEAKNILVDSIGIATMMSHVSRDLELIKSGMSKKNNTVLTNDLSWLFAYLQGLLKQPEDVKRICDELIDTIDAIIDRTNSGK